MLVDDDDVITEVLQARLSGHYDVVSTNSPENVLHLARRENPDLIICDIDMPEMDGGDISAALYADSELRNIPFMFLTSLASPEDLGSGREEIGGRAAISKHCSAKDLLLRIHSLIGK
ncbi:MAG: two-component system response regulator [Burkholderiales bacterium]